MELPFAGCEYYIFVVDLPRGIYAMVMPNDDTSFNIYLDARRSHEQWINDWEHEIWHIINDDFYNEKPIWVVENRTA